MRLPIPCGSRSSSSNLSCDAMKSFSSLFTSSSISASVSQPSYLSRRLFSVVIVYLSVAVEPTVAASIVTLTPFLRLLESFYFAQNLLWSIEREPHDFIHHSPRVETCDYDFSGLALTPTERLARTILIACPERNV